MAPPLSIRSLLHLLEQRLILLQARTGKRRLRSFVSPHSPIVLGTRAFSSTQASLGSVPLGRNCQN